MATEVCAFCGKATDIATLERLKQFFSAGSAYAIRSEMGSDRDPLQGYVNANKVCIDEWFNEWMREFWK